MNNSDSTPLPWGVSVPVHVRRLEAIARHPATVSKGLGVRVRPRRMRRFAILFIAGWLLAAGITTAGVVRADTPSPDVVDYARTYETAICGAILVNPTPVGVAATVILVERDGWTPYEAGQIITLAVLDACPNQMRTLQRFVDLYAAPVDAQAQEKIA
ncbi:MAG: hypothetical protein E6Q97_02580 [Desulfurellales bacterium]|nr:MAG: hypothetical protein E6Q97_02580 [Desulfurellales bacterium]